MTETPARKGGGMAEFAADLRALPGWQKIGFAVAGLLLVGGGVLYMLQDSAPPAAAPGSGQGVPPSLGQGYLDTRNPVGSRPSAGTVEDPWSAGMFRLGFSFFAGFSVGYALRKAAKMVVFACGLAFLFLFLLAYAELITVNWNGFDQLFAKLGERIQEESAKFQTFITGSLPSATLAGLGLYTGIRRRR